MIYVHMIKLNASMQFLLCLEKLEVVNVKLKLDQVSLKEERVNLFLFNNCYDFWCEKWI